MLNVSPESARQALTRLKAGERIVTNDETLDAIIDHCQDDDTRYDIRSIPNPKRCGIYDQYIAWIGPTSNPNDR